ncbi:hypothetical protein BUALT_Bualt09G0074900 [Buddleja alternifolia]|uniref:Gamma-tocopherol methyltransferase n=1 Tax=Buddleja alternifolia TaxID=168488 RepID=A0AAV6X247_9LAMI|nr:hypothetical protein BUALT_Bualt09G0074900 [Buddleja alternifolia]
MSGGRIVGSTCELGRLHVRGVGPLSCSTSFIIGSKSVLVSGCNTTNIPPFASLRNTFTRSGARRRMSVTAAATATATETLQKGIAEFYDESSGVWEDIWGDHMHHGFYEPDSDVSLSDHRSAQIRMIEESLRFAAVSDDLMRKPKSIVDVGCGIGGSSRYLAKKYGAEAQGITLSPVQAQRAQALADAQGLDGKASRDFDFQVCNSCSKLFSSYSPPNIQFCMPPLKSDRIYYFLIRQVSFQVADALNQPFPDGKFDLVWSMESGEHMPDKTKFVNELVRVAAPGGTIIIVTWCHRDLSPSEESLRQEEIDLLNKICNAYYLPAWCSTADYVKLLQSLSLEDIKAADWSQNVAPFWPAVIKSALTFKGITSLLRSGKPDFCALCQPNEHVTNVKLYKLRISGLFNVLNDGIKCGGKSNGSKEEEDGGNGLISDSGQACRGIRKACRGTGPRHQRSAAAPCRGIKTWTAAQNSRMAWTRFRHLCTRL